MKSSEEIELLDSLVNRLEAENADLRRELIRVIHATGGQCTDDVSTSFLMHAADEVTGKLADLRVKLAATGWQRIDTQIFVSLFNNATPEQIAKAMTRCTPEAEECGRRFEDDHQ